MFSYIYKKFIITNTSFRILDDATNKINFYPKISLSLSKASFKVALGQAILIL